MNEKIVPAEKMDFESIHQIEQVIFPHPYSLELLLQDFIVNPFSTYFKYEVNNSIIGYAGVWVIDTDGQIITIGIDLPYQGKGYGKRLMSHLMDYFRLKGCERITLEVRVSNEKAIRLYEGMGFVSVATRKHYYENGEDAYLMQCMLTR